MLIRTGLHVLAVVVGDDDLPTILRIPDDGDESVAKDARCCLFEHGVRCGVSPFRQGHYAALDFSGHFPRPLRHNPRLGATACGHTIRLKKFASVPVARNVQH